MKITEITKETNKWLNQNESRFKQSILAIILVATATIFIGGK